MRIDIPRLTWLNGKQFPQSLGARKNRPGENTAHTAAIVEDASRSLAKEIDKALAPAVESTPIPVVPMDAASEAITR